jgi:F5/8 type C domain
MRVGDGKGPGGYDSCYLDRQKKGVPDKNVNWNSYFTNPCSESWKEHVLAIAAKMEADYGVDGFFLDTIETITVYPDLKPGMISLIQALRAAHPNAIIILNRGFDVIKETSPIVDGFMFEDFSAGHYFDSRGYQFQNASTLDSTREQADNSVTPLVKQGKLVVLALDYAATAQEPYLKDASDRARTFGFIPYASTYTLGTIFDTPQGKYDPKWTKQLSSPESMSIILKNQANGFPEGTKILPSSTYADYSLSPLVDGIQDRSKLDWLSEAWASAEKKQAHYLEFQFPKPQDVNHLIIDWASDKGEAFPTRRFYVEVQPSDSDGGDWKRVWSTKDNLQKHCDIAMPSEEIKAFRITQEANGGSSGRPDLMWVEQVQIKQ